MTVPQQLRPVDAGSLPEYPISAADRLDSHYFIQFHIDRYDRSTFRRMAYGDPEVGFFGMELFYKAHGETPLGTLPSEPVELAFLLGISLERWVALTRREFSPLYNWSPVRCDNGQIRLAHPVVQETMEAALLGHKVHKASNEERAVSMRRGRLVKDLKTCGCSEELCKDDLAVGWIDDWLLENHKGQRRMPKFQASIARALRAAADAGLLGRRGGGG